MNQSIAMRYREFYSHNPDKFYEDMFNVKLTFWQKVYIKIISHLPRIKGTFKINGKVFYCYLWERIGK